MPMMRKVRPLLFVLGGLLVIGSLLGARLLTHGAGGGTSDPVAKATPINAAGSGPVVIGYVDSDPPPVYTLLPPHLPSGEIEKVFVTSGTEVKVGDALYKFNSTILEQKKKEADKAVVVAKANVRKAKAMQVQHKTSIDAQKLQLEVANDKEERTLKGHQLYKRNFLSQIPKETPPDRIDELVANDPELYKLETAWRTAVLEHRKEDLALKALETADIGAATAIAEAEVERYEALVEEAQTAVDLCTIRAKVAGTIEQVNVSAGSQVGVSTRTPAVVLVPAGPRVVRAEVEADFAHRVGKDKIDKVVTIYDNNDAKITYKGTVKRIGDTFLPKRSGGDGLIPNETRVLEALIEVSDPSPAGKPPLRVGQKVRVNFGQ